MCRELEKVKIFENVLLQGNEGYIDKGEGNSFSCLGFFGIPQAQPL